MENTLYLKDLDCANCANKIEREVEKLEGVESCTVDFLNKKLVYTTDSNDPDLRNKIDQIVLRIEPGVEIVEEGAIKEKDLGTTVSCSCDKQDDKQGDLASDEEEEEESKSLIKRLIISAAVLLLSIFINVDQNIKSVLYIVSYLIAGYDVILGAIKGIRYGDFFSEYFLMTIATIGAFVVGEYTEAVAVMLFYMVGEIVEDKAVNRSRKSIKGLLDIQPEYANLFKDGKSERVSPKEVQIGDLIMVKPGERVPLDGTVIEGSSYMDTSAMTGESVKREVKEGDQVLSGFINDSGLLKVKVEKTYDNSAVSRVLDMVENAGSKKASTERFITKFSRYYTPIVCLLALLMVIFQPILIESVTLKDALYRACTFLVISCPCALVLAVPLGFYGGLGGASNKGILVKGMYDLENLHDVDSISFDKTGTITKGNFKVVEVNPSDNYDDGELLSAAAYAENYSDHPIGLSIVERYGKENIQASLIEDQKEIAGRGIEAHIGGKKILAGNSKLMRENDVEFDESTSPYSLVYVAMDNSYMGYLVIADQVKETSKEAIQELKDLGIKDLVMLTGDREEVARAVARETGVTSYQSDLLPEGKYQYIEEYKEKNPDKKIAFVGDGINDAPVLARADIGISMGSKGSDAAIEASDVVIMNDDLKSVATSIRIARKTRRIVYQGIVFALSVKIFFLILSALGLANMWMGVFADVGVTILCVLNATRAMNVKGL